MHQFPAGYSRAQNPFPAAYNLKASGKNTKEACVNTTGNQITALSPAPPAGLWKPP